MNLPDFLQLLVVIAVSLVTGAWIYAVWCVGQVTKAYRLRSDLAAVEAEYYAKRLDRLGPLVETWERSIQRMDKELAALQAQLGETTAERNDLAEKVAELLRALKKVRETGDPLAGMLLNDIDERPW